MWNALNYPALSKTVISLDVYINWLWNQLKNLLQPYSHNLTKFMAIDRCDSTIITAENDYNDDHARDSRLDRQKKSYGLSDQFLCLQHYLLESTAYIVKSYFSYGTLSRIVLINFYVLKVGHFVSAFFSLVLSYFSR